MYLLAFQNLGHHGNVLQASVGASSYKSLVEFSANDYFDGYNIVEFIGPRHRGAEVRNVYFVNGFVARVGIRGNHVPIAFLHGSQEVNGGLVGGDDAVFGPQIYRHVAECHAASHAEGINGGARKFEGFVNQVAVPAHHAHDVQTQIFGHHPRLPSARYIKLYLLWHAKPALARGHGNGCIRHRCWDGSDVTVTGRCVGNNQVRFVLTNTGTSPMTVAQSYWIVEDNIMVRGGTFQLAASGSDSVTITADPHKIYRIIAAETAGNPAHNTQETFLVWGCNGATNTIHWGFVNQYALNLGSAFEHQLCTQVRTSFDPNEISAVPEGVQNEHFIPKDTEIEYTIRFQNTGNDTAFVVRLLNTLPDALDKTTLKIGASSHPMTYSLKGNGVLEFLYTNILLPDSTTNEAKSHGFVRYKIRTKSNVVAGQTIDNQANIYFDVNAPVATNTYRHTIAADVASVFFSLSEVVTNRNYTVRVVPNPMRDAALLEIIANEDIQHSVKIFTLYNVFGQAITTQTFNDNTLLLQRENMPSGCYIYTINIDNEQISKGKIVVE